MPLINVSIISSIYCKMAIELIYVFFIKLDTGNECIQRLF